MDAFHKVLDKGLYVAGHIAADLVVVVSVRNAKAVGHNGRVASRQQRCDAEAAAGDDVVADGSSGWMCVEAVQRPTLGGSQVLQSSQVTEKALAW